MTATEPPAPTAPTTQPAATGRQRLALVGFSVLFALWVAGLIAIYAFSVYPQRHPKAGPATQHVAKPAE